MSIIRVGSTSSYAEGWEAIFGASDGKPSGRAGAKKSAGKKKSAAKKTAKKKPTGKSRRG
jgi:hypothetical protein